MIEDSALEKMLRDKISNEKINFPEKLNEKIKTVIRELPERKEKLFPWKAAMAAAALALILTTSIILFRGNIKENLLAVTNHSQAKNKIAVVSNQELINKFKSEGYIVEKNIGDSAKVQGGYSLGKRVRYYVNLEELVDASDIIIEGEVLAVRYFDYNKMTYTESKVLITKSYNNKVSTGEVVTFCESGGFTTKYNIIQYNDIEENRKDFEKPIIFSPEELEKVKDIKVFVGSFCGGTIMQPSDKVILFGEISKDQLIKGSYYYTVGGFEGKFVIKDNTAERIIPQGEVTPALKMSIQELSNKLTDIIKNR
jgi:hypothetical protein